MLLGGETACDSFSPSSNGNISTNGNVNENEHASMMLSGSPVNTPPSPPTLEPSLANVNLLQQNHTTQIADDYSKSSPKDNNQNFLPTEGSLDMYQPSQQQQHQQQQTHVSPRVQPYDLNIAHQQAHHHHLRSSNHMNQYNNNNNGGRKIPSPYKNLNNMMNQNPLLYDGHIVSSSSGNDMMVLKEEPENENGY
jgi:hypothetical protein